MQINPLNNNPYFSQGTQGKPSESKNASGNNPKIQDKLEISPEARSMQQASSEGKNLEEIKNKISSKFYNSDEVVNTVANKILKEISTK